MSTPLPRVNKRQIYIDADEAEQRRRLFDDHDTKRRLVLNELSRRCCKICDEEILFSRCKVGDLGECMIAIITDALERGSGWSDRFYDLELHGSD